MRIFCSIAMSRKMLESGTDTVAFQPLCKGNAHIGYQLGVTAEGTVADDRVFRIGPHIRHRRKIHIESIV